MRTGHGRKPGMRPKLYDLDSAFAQLGGLRGRVAQLDAERCIDRDIVRIIEAETGIRISIATLFRYRAQWRENMFPVMR